MRQSRTGKPKNVLLEKIGTVYPRPNGSGATVRVLGRYINNKMNDESDNAIYTIKSKPYGKVLVARLTVECHNFSNHFILKYVLPMILHVLRSHPVLCSVSSKY